MGVPDDAVIALQLRPATLVLDTPLCSETEMAFTEPVIVAISAFGPASQYATFRPHPSPGGGKLIALIFGGKASTVKPDLRTAPPGCGRHSVADSDSSRHKSVAQSSFAPTGL